MTQQNNPLTYDICDKLNNVIQNKYIDKFIFKDQFSTFNKFIQTCRNILKQSSYLASQQLLNDNQTDQYSDEGKHKQALNFYIKQSINDNFQYKNVKAGSRPEIQELMIRGNIHDDYKLRISQDIITLLNKLSDENILNALIDLIDDNLKENSQEQLNYLIFDIYAQLYDKACIEVKYTQLYAKIIIQLTQKLSHKPYIQLTKNFIIYYHKDVLQESDTGFYQKNYDVSFELHKVVQNIIFSKHLKEEIDTKQPKGSKYQINESDDAQTKQQKSNIIEVHLKQSCLLVLYLYLEDINHKIITYDIFSSFLLYLLKKQAEYNKKKYTVSNQNQLISLINTPKMKISDTMEGFYLKSVITVLLELKKKQNNIKIENDDMKTVIEILQSVDRNILAAYDDFALSETLQTNYKQTNENEIALTEEQKKQIKQEASSQKEILKKEFETNMDEVRAKWVHEEYNIFELFSLFTDISEDQKDKVDQLFASKNYEPLEKCFDLLIKLINDDRTQSIFLKQFQRIISFISNHDVYILLLNVCIKQTGDAYHRILCHYMHQEKISFQMIFQHKDVENSQLQTLIDKQIRHFFLQQLEEYEEGLNSNECNELKLLIRSAALSEISNHQMIIKMMRDDGYSYFTQKDAVQDDLATLPTAFDTCAVTALKKWLFRNITAENFVAKITQYEAKTTSQAIKTFFTFYPPALQLFDETKYCSEPEIKNMDLRLFNGINQYMLGQKDQLIQLLTSQKHFIAAQVLDVIYNVTNIKYEDKFVEILMLFDGKVDKSVRNELVEKHVKGDRKYGKNLQLKEWLSKQRQ